MATPDELIQDARDYAVTVLADSAAALGFAMESVNSIGGGYIAEESVIPPVPVRPPQPRDPGELEAYAGKRFDGVEFNGQAPTLGNVGTLSLPASPGTAPSVLAFDAPVKPADTTDRTLIQGAPSLETPVIPDAPDLSFTGIVKPALIAISVPNAPAYQKPQFLGVKPNLNLTPPSDLDVLMHTNYTTIAPVMRDALDAELDAFLDALFPEFRPGMAALEAKLAQYIAGGTALTPAIEDAIYNRTLDKTNKDGQRASDEAWGKAARAGYTMPSPMLLAQQIDLDQNRRDNNARAAIDIAVKQAELEQANVQFAVTQSSTLRKIALDAAMSYHGNLVQLNGQALQYAREVVDAVVKTYDITARMAEASIRVYESDARVYEAEIRAAMAPLDAYVAQLKGVEAQANVNVANLRAYSTEIETITARANAYRAQVDGALAAAQIEKLKIEIYQAQVNAYVAQVNAYSAQWNGYKAQVDGESAKVSASAEQVRAFQARVQAYTAEVEAKATELRAISETNVNKIAAYRSEVEAYRAFVDAEATGVKAEIDSYQATTHAYTARANAISQVSQADIQYYKIAYEGLRDAAALQFEYLRESNNLQVARATAVGHISGMIGDAYGRLAQSTLAGMNTLVSASQTSQT